MIVAATENVEVEELVVAMEDTKESARALISLREELAALGCSVRVDPQLWRRATDGQREVEAAYLDIFNTMREQALRSIQDRIFKPLHAYAHASSFAARRAAQRDGS